MPHHASLSPAGQRTRPHVPRVSSFVRRLKMREARLPADKLKTSSETGALEHQRDMAGPAALAAVSQLSRWGQGKPGAQ